MKNKTNDYLFIKAEDIKATEPFPGVVRRVLQGKNLTVCMYKLKKGMTFPAHQHANEQMAYIVKGKCEFSMGENGEKQIFEEGMFFAFGPNAKHGTRFLEDSIVIDIFAPPMKDYEKDAHKPEYARENA